MMRRIRVRLGSARMVSDLPKRLKNERPLRVIGKLRAHVLDAPFPFGSEKIEPEAVLSWIGFRHQARPKHHPLRGVHDTLEDGVLYPLPTIFAQPSYAAQSAASGVVAGAYVVADKNHHRITSRRTRDRRRGRRVHGVPAVAPARTAQAQQECAPL